ncbi:MAG: CoA pyrophosphatase [Acidimicrobiia bacterium]
MWDRLHLNEDPPELGDGPVAAVLAALYEDDDDRVRIVLTKRPDTMPTHAGHISLPGGRAHPADQGPVETALREAHEEVGIDPSAVEVLGFLPAIDTVEFKPWVVPVVGRLKSPVHLIPSEREVVRIYTPPLEELADENRWWSVPWNGHQVWYYDLGGDTLWGATARMVRSLVGLL